MGAISAAERHALFLDFDGGVWGVGDNRKGQLGLGLDAVDTRPRKFPLHVTLLPENITAISAAAHASAALTSDGVLYLWGSFGSINAPSPRIIDLPDSDPGLPFDRAIQSFIL